MRRHTLTSTSIVRTYNAAVILQALHRAGSCSRSRLTELTHMSPATVSRITARLIDQGIVIEERVGRSTGGRPPVILRLNYERLYVIGIRLLRDQVSLGIFDLNGRLIHKTSYVPYGLDSDFLIRELHGRTERLLEESGLRTGSHLLGAGLAVAGVVRNDDGTVVRSVNLGWRDVPLAEQFGELLQLPVFVENDANAGALAEVWLGGADDLSNIMYIKTDTGVGAGVILEQRLITGPRGMVGEIGHIPIQAPGHLCRCGQRGCLETYLYLPDVFGRYSARTGKSINKTTFFDSATKGDREAAALVEEARAALTMAISASAAMLDLDKVIVDGIWGSFSSEFLHRIEKDVQATLQRTGLDKAFSVRPSGLGVDSDLLGAVGLVSNRLFSTPAVFSNVNESQLTAQLSSARG